MGCFLGCFGSSKDRKRRKQRYKVIPRDQNPRSQNLVQADISLVLSIKDKPSNPVSESRLKTEEPLSLSTRKKVTFDTNVTTYEHIEVYDSTESLLEKNEKGETFPKTAETHHNSDDDPITSNVKSYPPNYRYGNCVESDDEVEDLDYDDYDTDEEDDDGVEDEEDYDDENGIICQEVWSESIPVRSMESRTELSNKNARDRSVYVHPVLNPVENLTQWKALKSKERPTPQKPLTFNKQKENSLTPEPKHRNQELAVDASLSNWLISSEKNTPNDKRVDTITPEKSLSQGSTTNSMKSIEDRPILGALTMDELKQFSASSTPRKSPSRSPDDMTIIGSVGSYWSQTGSVNASKSTSSYKGIPNSTSKYREDKKVNWHNTPFETRLERALTKGAAEA